MSSAALPTNPLRDLLTRYRQRVRWAVWTVAVGRWLAFALLAMTAACWLDYAFRWESTGVRVSVTVVVSVLVLANGWWFVWRPARVKMSDEQLALQLERHDSRVRGLLASAVQFEGEGFIEKLGSPELQQAVARDAQRVAEQVDIEPLVDLTRSRRWLLAALSVTILVAVVCLAHPAGARVALRRFAAPTAVTYWPQIDRLQLLSEDLSVFAESGHPVSLAAGSSLRIYVRNKSRALPDDMTAEILLADESIIERPVRRVLRVTGDERQEILGELRLGRLQDSFAIRVVGGDDYSMPWVPVIVIQPPRLEHLKVRVTPPAYTRQPPRLQPEGVGDLQALVGSRIEFTARANRELSAVRLLVDGQEVPGVRIDTADKKSLQGTFLIAEGGQYPYVIELTDRHGVEPPDQPSFLIAAQTDGRPTIHLVQPSADLFVTQQARIPVTATAEDDVLVDRGVLKLRVDGAPAEMPFTKSTRRSDGWTEFQTTVDVARLNLQPGQAIEATAECRDTGQGLGDRTAQSESRRLEVVRPEDKIEELGLRERKILDDLVRHRDAQQSLTSAIEELIVQAGEVGKLTLADLDQLRRIEQQTSQLRMQLSGRMGAAREAAGLLEEVQWNRIEAVELVTRLQRLMRELKAVEADHVLPLLDDIVDVRKRDELSYLTGGTRLEKADAGPDPQRSAAASRLQLVRQLQSARQHQLSTVRVLTQLTSQLQRRLESRQLQRELSELIDGQDRLERDTARVMEQTIALGLSELTTQSRADLARLAHRQKQLAVQFQAWAADIHQLVLQSTQQPDSLAPSVKIDQAVQGAAIEERMQQAADSIRLNRTGEATSLLRELLQRLRDLQAMYGADGPDDEARIQELDQLAREIDAIRERSVTARQAAGDPRRQSELINSVRELQDRLRDVANRLHALPADAAAEAAEAAATRASRVWTTAGTSTQQETSTQLEHLVSDVVRVQQLIAIERGRISQRAFQIRFEQFRRGLNQTWETQQQIARETSTLSDRFQQSGRWSRSTLRSLTALAGRQQELHDQLEQDRNEIDSLPAVDTMLTGIIEHMAFAAENLASRQVGEVCQDAQLAAVDQLLVLIEALAAIDGVEPGEDLSASASKAFGTLGAQLRVTAAWQRRVLEQTTAADSLDNDLPAQRRLLARAQIEQSGIHAAVSAVGQQFQNLTPPDGSTTESVDFWREARAGLQRAAQLTQRAAKALKDGDGSASTRSWQAQTIEILDGLIQQATPETAFPDSRVVKNDQAMDDPTSSTTGDPPVSATDPEASRAENAAQGGDDAGRGADGADDQRPELPGVDRRLLEGVWGHLPPEIQRQIVNVSSYRSLPQYSDEVRDYFESLNRTGNEQIDRESPEPTLTP